MTAFIGQPGQKGPQAVADCAPEKAAQLRAESALDATLQHVNAPQQQGD